MQIEPQRRREIERRANADVREQAEEAEQEAQPKVWIAALRHERCERAAVQTRAGWRFLFVEVESYQLTVGSQKAKYRSTAEARRMQRNAES